MAKIRGFAEPSEFAEPLELLRAGMLFHARGLVNTKAIQNNLDWVWPYWVERQFNPSDESFIPRAFSFSHINLTHRNWTAVGLPDVPFYPIVDPRGMVTPLFDGWSLDFWLVPEREGLLLPSKLADFEQSLTLEDNLIVRSTGRWRDTALHTTVALCLHNHEPHCCATARVEGMAAGYLAVALRPYNPEGISFVEKIALTADGCGWRINGRHSVLFDRAPARMMLSKYKEGDVAQRLQNAGPGNGAGTSSVSCEVGMATAVALFDLKSLRNQPLEVRAPIYDELEPKKRPSIGQTPSWTDAMRSLARLDLGDARVQRLYDLGVANLMLHAPDEVYPGPYTYKRFWFRDAAFMLNAVLAVGAAARTRRVLRHFAPRQRHDGYFLSQEGEWDSNGEAIWMLHRYVALTGESLPEEWLAAIEKGARWIMRKRLPKDTGLPEAGLLPAGFSAEHLGPNDFYYWDDFWGVAGLRCAAELLQGRSPKFAEKCRREADDFMQTIERSFPAGPHRRFPGAIPASPKRRMDSGAVGNLVADYPLQLFAAGDERMLKTADYLRDHSSLGEGFFQNMIHSGINAYLTLHLAQVRLRAGQVEAAWRLMEHVAELASPTGQWPEAIHPRTGGGCMGDGEHMWAAAEWVLLVRSLFVREENGKLVVASGLRPEWWHEHGALFGPTLTPHGAVSVRIEPVTEPAAGTPVGEARPPAALNDGLTPATLVRQRPRTAERPAATARVVVEGAWRGAPPEIEVRLPGYSAQHRTASGAREEFILSASR